MPPLAADRRAHAPRRARGELLVPAPPGRLRVDRGARARAGAWSTWPAARATAPTCWRAARGRRGRRRRQPRGLRARAPALPRPNLRFERDLVETLRGALRRGRVPADDRARRRTRARCSSSSRRCWRPAASRTSRRPTCSRSRRQGAERSGNPWHVREYRAEEFGRSAGALRPRRAARPVPRAQAARPRAGAARRLGRACTRALRPHRAASTTGSCRRSTTRDFALRGAAASSTARSTSSPSAGRERRARARRARARPAHPHALRRGLRHLAVRRGVAVGGDRRLATCRCSTCSTRGGRVTLSVTPGARRPARGAPAARGERFLRLHARRARVDARARRRGPARRRRARLAAEVERARRRLRARRGALRGAAAATCSAPAAGAGAQLDLGGHARGAAAARDRRAACGCSSRPGSASHRARFGAWSGGFWLPECALRAVARAAARGGGRARDLRRPDRRLGLGPAATPCAALAPRGRCSCRSTGQPSSSSGATRLPRRTAATATTTTTRSTTTGRGRTTARPTTTTRRAALAREHAARLRRARRARSTLPRGARAPGLLRVRAGHRAARPLVVRRGRVAARGARRGGRAGPGARPARRRAGAPRAGVARRRPARVDAGARRGPVDVGRARRSPTWPGGPRASCGAARGRAPARGARRAAVRELLALPVQRLGVHGHAASWRRDYPARERAAEHTAAAVDALELDSPAGRVRHVAPCGLASPLLAAVSLCAS